MLLAFDRALSRQEIFANGDELAQVLGRDRDAAGRRVRGYPREVTAAVTAFDRPVLVTDHHRIAGLPPTLRDTVFALLSSPHRTTIYDGTPLEFEQGRHPGVWGPSIDTLLFCRALAPERLASVRTAADIGCGSGFLSRYLLEHAPRLERLVTCDISEAAIACAREHLPDARVEPRQGDGRTTLAGERFDLAVSNPPYIPRPRSIDDNPYEGIGLLHWLVAEGRSLLAPGGRLVTNVSSLCRATIERTAERAGTALAPLDGMEVPLKVMNVLNNAEWMAYLASRCGLARHLRQGYEAWHAISIVEVSAR